MNLRGTVTFSLVLNTADRTHFASHAYGAQSEYEATGINLDYNWLLKDIWYDLSNENGSLKLERLESALHENKILVHTGYEFRGPCNSNTTALVMDYLCGIKDLVNKCFDKNEADLPESEIVYKEGLGFFIPFEMGEKSKWIDWYRVQVIGAHYPHEALEDLGLYP